MVIGARRRRYQTSTPCDQARSSFPESPKGHGRCETIRPTESPRVVWRLAVAIVVTPWRQTPDMEIVELRTCAKAEVLELGPRPIEPREHEVWVAERRCSMALLADLADRDRDLLRRAATGDWVTTEVRDLLLAAANEC